jgi:hypothetical protein
VGFGARADPVIPAAPRGFLFRPRASGGTVGFDCRGFALRFGPPPSRSGQSSYFGHAPEWRDLWFSSPDPGKPDPSPYAKPAATPADRDLWFSSAARSEPTPPPGSPADDQGQGRKIAGDFRAARTGCPGRGLGATGESFPPVRAGRRLPLPPLRNSRSSTSNGHPGFICCGGPVIRTAHPGRRRERGFELSAGETEPRIAPA